MCNTKIHETQPLLNLKLDRVMQDIVYKLVPGLQESECSEGGLCCRDGCQEQPRAQHPVGRALSDGAATASGSGECRVVRGGGPDQPPSLRMGKGTALGTCLEMSARSAQRSGRGALSAVMEGWGRARAGVGARQACGVGHGPAARKAGGDLRGAESMDGGLRGSSWLLPGLLQSREMGEGQPGTTSPGHCGAGSPQRPGGGSAPLCSRPQVKRRGSGSSTSPAASTG